MTITPTVRVQREDFDLQAEVDRLSRGRPGIGAIVTFSGLCRDEGGTLSALELEHYPGMAEAEIERICREAVERFSLQAAAAIHRYGKIMPGENIVLVVTASAHRAAALEACHFLIDWLKTKAPFWKLEETGDGAARWVDARSADDAAAERWARPGRKDAAE